MTSPSLTGAAAQLHAVATAAGGRRVSGAACLAYAACWLTAAVLEGVVIHFTVVSPAELVAAVARLRHLWILAQALLILLPVLIVAVLAGVLTLTAPRRVTLWLAVPMFGLSALMSMLSGVFHGVFGWHVSALAAVSDVDGSHGTQLAEILHALGDTCYDIAILATAFALLALVPALRGSPRLPRGVAWLALAAAVLEIVEFGYFLSPLPALTYAAPAGVLLQAVWYFWLGLILTRRAEFSI